MNEPKNCPFCGGPPRIYDRDNDSFRLVCENEECPLGWAGLPIEHTLWNTRASTVEERPTADDGNEERRPAAELEWDIYNAHFVNVVLRINGEWRFYEADFLKDLMHKHYFTAPRSEQGGDQPMKEERP